MYGFAPSNPIGWVVAMEKPHVSCLRNMKYRYRFIVHGGKKMSFVANSFKVNFGLFCGAHVTQIGAIQVGPWHNTHLNVEELLEISQNLLKIIKFCLS
jgi:hypothetical protein